MESAAGDGYEVSEGVFPLGDLMEAEEVFTSSSVREVMPAAELDGRPVRRGPAAEALQAALRAAATLPA
jgi:branched-subunit amino acid aminotransferase/4-amino-4-deoxychorismate lyase